MQRDKISTTDARESLIMFSEIRVFVWRHWPHLILAVPGLILVTLVHEAAHAGAVLLQGGLVLEFAWLPDGMRWGHVSYDLPSSSIYSLAFLDLAPYLVWLTLALTAVLLSLRRKTYPFWTASSIFFWLYIVPLGDIGNTAFPYLRGSFNDFTSVFQSPTPLAWSVIAAGVAVAVGLGFGVQRRLYGEAALSRRSCLVLVVITLLGLIFAVDWLYRWVVWILNVIFPGIGSTLRI